MRFNTGCRWAAALGRYLGCPLTAAILLTVLWDKPTYAAIDVTLSRDMARPGDEVVLRTDNHGDSNLYGFLGSRPMTVFLIAETDLTKLIESGAQVCGSPNQHRLGEMIWTNGVGQLTFDVPAVRPGRYSFLVDVGQASPGTSCWHLLSTLLVTRATVPASKGAGWPMPLAVMLFALAFGAFTGGVALAARRRLSN